MKFLDYAKQYHNFDIFLVLLDDAGFTDEEIATKFEVSRQGIYNARKRLEPIITAIKDIDGYKRDLRNNDVQKVIDLFQATFGTTSSTAIDRYAAKRLHAKYGDDILKVIQALAKFGSEKYCPTVNSVYELEKKLPGVIKFLKQQSETNLVIDL